MLISSEFSGDFSFPPPTPATTLFSGHLSGLVLALALTFGQCMILASRFRLETIEVAVLFVFHSETIEGFSKVS